MKKKNQNGITLIALIVTIVVLLILAGVSISVVLGDNGLIENAREAKRQTESKSAQELNDIEKLEADVAKQSGAFNNEKGVNEPNLKTGMTPIYFELGSDDIYKEKVTTQDADNWYNYKEKKWANAQTKDGSMWVWIPRFAYKINDDNKTFDVKFLMGTTDYYLDENNIPQKAVRGTDDSSPDTRKEYTVHPAFTDETSIGFKNGGWDSELTGIWVAKFEAGFATSNGNKTENKKSSIVYTQSQVFVGKAEAGTEQDSRISARNWLDGVYGDKIINISYPIFQGEVYSFNYVNEREAFALCSVLTEKDNIYGLNDETNSHLMKNSEWGDSAYLAQSIYGLNGTNIYINNITLNSGNSSKEKTNGNEYASVYAVTGLESNSGSDTQSVMLANKNQINIKSERKKANIQLWADKDGGKSSTTGNIYGIFDMSGGSRERTASFIANDNIILYTGNTKNVYTGSTEEKYKRSFTFDLEKSQNLKVSNKYVTIYPCNLSSENKSNFNEIVIDHWNYNMNLKNRIYGDAVFEIAQSGNSRNDNEFFFGDNTYFPASGGPFFIRGSNWDGEKGAGIFSFEHDGGSDDYIRGFRAVLV